jgi:hypothetical protein
VLSTLNRKKRRHNSNLLVPMVNTVSATHRKIASIAPRGAPFVKTLRETVSSAKNQERLRQMNNPARAPQDNNGMVPTVSLFLRKNLYVKTGFMQPRKMQPSALNVTLAV